MISRNVLEVQFLEEIEFYQNPVIVIFNQLLRFIQDLNCVQTDKRCLDCSKRTECRYYWMTGENFSAYSGIITKIDPFEKRYFQSGESLQIPVNLLGSVSQYYLFLTLFAENCTTLFGKPVFCRMKPLEAAEESILSVHQITFKTPYPSQDFFQEYNTMAAYYDEHYECRFPLIAGTQEIQGTVLNLVWPSVQVSGRRFHPRGWVYECSFQYPIGLPREFLEIGVGRWNWLGGGSFEIKTYI